jgi:U3 small nucleolar RNA-associated protein 20
MGSVLRRLKSVARQRAVVLMAQSLEGVEDASTWIVVFARKVRMLRFSSRLF